MSCEARAPLFGEPDWAGYPQPPRCPSRFAARQCSLRPEHRGEHVYYGTATALRWGRGTVAQR